MRVALWFGIAGLGVVLLGTFVLIGDQWPWFHRVFGWINRRYGAIEKGLGVLFDDSAKDSETKGRRCLSEEEPGFQEILEAIAERTRIELAEISAICCGAAWGVGSTVYENISLLDRSGSTSNARMPTREVLERWLHDARLRCVSHVGFGVVVCGVSLSVVSLIIRC